MDHRPFDHDFSRNESYFSNHTGMPPYFQQPFQQPPLATLQHLQQMQTHPSQNYLAQFAREQQSMLEQMMQERENLYLRERSYLQAQQHRVQQFLAEAMRSENEVLKMKLRE